MHIQSFSHVIMADVLTEHIIKGQQAVTQGTKGLRDKRQTSSVFSALSVKFDFL